MQHYLLYKRHRFDKHFRMIAQELEPLYKRLGQMQRKAFCSDEQNAFSSPVCYNHLKEFREGFNE